MGRAPGGVTSERYGNVATSDDDDEEEEEGDEEEQA